jgi:hypothetical protein
MSQDDILDAIHYEDEDKTFEVKRNDKLNVALGLCFWMRNLTDANLMKLLAKLSYEALENVIDGMMTLANVKKITLAMDEGKKRRLND